MDSRIRPLFVSALVASLAALPAPSAPAPLLLPSGGATLSADSAETARKSFAAMGKSLADDKSADVYIVQYDPATTLASALRRLIDDCGAVNVGAVPGGAYLVRATKSQCLALLESGAVVATRPYDSRDKGVPVAPFGTDAKGLAPGAAPMTTYTVSLFRDADEAAVRKRLASFGGCEVLDGGDGRLRVRMTEAAHRRAAALQDIAAIGPWFEPKLFNDVATAAMGVDTVWPASASRNASATTALNLTGKGQIVAVCDSGLDTGNLKTVHPDVRGRIVQAFACARENDWSDMNGHGTHVVGSVLGNGAASDGAVKGAAFEAELVMQSCGADSSGTLYIDTANILGQAYDVRSENGLSPRIHSNSWGGNAQGLYASQSAIFDRETFARPDLLVVVAAGNSGTDREAPYGVIDPGSMGTPATAKNILTVGATETGSHDVTADEWLYGDAWPDNYSHAPIKDDGLGVPPSGKTRGMAAFSSRGPCSDGRVKPDVVAPGCLVKSLRATVNDSMVDPDNDRYCYMQGTSMATPLVSGTAALVRQWLEEKREIANPDAATVKAVLCAGAKSLYPGQYGTGEFLEIPKEYPNNVEGWGMVDLENSIANPDGVAVWNGEVIQDHARLTYHVRAPGGKPLVILMAYDDAEGVQNQGGLVNDLDMTVTDPAGKVWYPNSRAEADRLNNVEGVRWDEAPEGEYVVSVVATSIQEPMPLKWTKGADEAVRFSLVANGAISNPSDKPETPDRPADPPPSPEPEPNGPMLLDTECTFFCGYCYCARTGKGGFLPAEAPAVIQAKVTESYQTYLVLIGKDESAGILADRFNLTTEFETDNNRKVFVLPEQGGTGWAFLSSSGELALGFDMSDMGEGTVLLVPFDIGDTFSKRFSELNKGELGPLQLSDDTFKGCVEWLTHHVRRAGGSLQRTESR